ncbi:MAG: sulfite exporter TauE/SafE family protein, partial [Actinomycetota bacterium]
IFGLTGVIASYTGTALNHSVNPDALLLAFAGLIAVAATGMLIHIRHDRTTLAAAPPPRAGVPAMSAAAISTYGLPVPDGSGSTFPPAPGHDSGRPAVTPGTAAKVILAGLIVGFLTGFFGVGGGFVIVPALVMVLGYDMPVAVGTSLLIIAINSAAALLARTGSESFHWSVIIPFTIAAIAGCLAGTRIACHVSSTTLTKAFAVLLFAVAIYVAIRSGIGLSS